MNSLSFHYTKEFYAIQDNWWMGSSGAFCISSLLFYSMYKLWQEKGFKVYTHFTLILLGYIAVVYINESRLGILYIVLFSVFLLLKNFKFKKIINAFLLILIVCSFYTMTSYLVGETQNKYSHERGVRVLNNRNIIKDTKNIIFSNNKDRTDELIKGLDKFKEYPTLNKIVGTGWYTSRITINLNKEEIKNFEFNKSYRKTYQLQGIISILLDTGMVGIFFLLILNSKTIFYIWRGNDNLIDKTFFILLIGLNFFTLFIGYPLVNLVHILFYLPGGIVDNKKIKI